tara:strand:+ start:142 stop:456 length:315 start_codon:yes stop_codon:yes gene_type:complete
LSPSISSKEFSFVYNNSFIIKTSNILYRALPSDQTGRLGFIIGSHMGAAHKRNLFRRRIKFLYNRHFIRKNKKIDIIIAPKTINLGFQEMEDSFKLMSERIYGI